MAILATVLLLVLVGLTRTQVGRDQVAGQIEAQFAQQFEGSVTVGRLTGTLLWDLYARDVVVRDAQGRAVITVDSVVLEPRWRSLVSNRLELKRATLVRPLIELVREDGGWNLASAFRSTRAPRDQAGRRLDLNAPEIRIIDGTVTTRNDGALPAAVSAGSVFDYTNTRLAALNARAYLDFRGDRQRVRILRLNGHVPGVADIARMQGRLALDGGRVHADGVTVRLAQSELSGAFRRGRTGDANVTLSRIRLAGDEIRRIFPAYPLHGDVAVSGRASGPFDDLRIGRLQIASGGSRLSLTGSVAGLPGSAIFDLTSSRLDLRQQDISALLGGGSAIPPVGTITGTLAASGAADWNSAVYRTDADIDLRSSTAGSAQGTARLASGPGTPMSYALNLQVRGVDPGMITGDPALAGAINGRVIVDGRGFTVADLASRARLALTDSRFAGRSFTALEADMTASGGRIRGTVELESSGTLGASGEVDLLQRNLVLDLSATAFDIRSLAADAPQTSLSGLATLSASGATLDDLSGDLAVNFDGATATVADSTWLLPGDPILISARPRGSAEPRLRLSTEALTLDADGDFGWAGLIAAAGYWGERIVATASRDLLPRRLGGWEPDENVYGGEFFSLPHAFSLRMIAHEEHALAPWVASVAPGSAAFADIQVAGDSIRIGAVVNASRVRIGEVEMSMARADASVNLLDSDDLLRSLALRLDAHADTLVINGGNPLQPSVLAAFKRGDRALDLSVRASRGADGVSGDLAARIDVLPDKYRLAGSMSLTAPGEHWVVNDASVDLYTDALVFRRFAAERIAPLDGVHPRLNLSGVASARAQDTLRIQAAELQVEEILELLGLNLPFDGLANADLLVTGTLGQPAVRGDAIVEEFTIWGDRAGRLIGRSEIVSGRDGFDVDITLQPDSEHAAIRNDARLAGSLRLPGRLPDGSRDRGFFDLEVDFRRLDLFIFNHFFPTIVAGTTGGASGQGTIRGDWSFPLFDADLRIADGKTRIPDFNLALNAAGRLTVDRRGIHLHGVTLRDKVGGSGRVNGGILFNEYRYFSFDLAAQLSEFEVIDVNRSQAGTLPFYGHVRATGSASLTGPINEAFFRSPDAVTTADSRLFIPVVASGPAGDAGFLVFADADGRIPEAEVRRNLIADRPEGERPFLDGLQMLLNVDAPAGSTVQLVFDPVIGDVINAVGSGRLQLAITEGEFRTFGSFEVERGDYLFTAGDVFTRRFELERGGTLEWDGDPIDARMDLPATYRTRASLAGLGLGGADERQRVPFIVRLDVGGRVTAPLVELSLELDESAGRSLAVGEVLRRRLNEPDRQAEYATSVLLTNTFLLAPSERAGTFGEAADDLLFTSLTELVSTRLNLFLNQALGADNLDVAFGVQQGSGIQDFDLTYGVAIRLLDERLVIRGEGVYQQLENRPASDALQGEIAVELRVSDGVSVEVFYRREGDVLLGSSFTASPTGAYGAGINYRTEFTSWRRLVQRVLATEPRTTTDVVTAASE